MNKVPVRPSRLCQENMAMNWAGTGDRFVAEEGGICENQI